jgi:hypothetical protein
MKKQTTTLLMIAGAGALAYYFFKNKSGARMIESGEEAENTKETGKGSETMPEQTEVDTVIDTTKTGTPVATAIRQAKQLANALQDANIIIKTPEGQANIAVRKGKKKRIKRRTKRAISKNCSKIKNARRRKRCEMSKMKLASQFLRPSFVPSFY